MQASARLSSSAAFKKVIAGVSSATTRPCYRTSRGKAHAAPATKGRKRITKQERRARIVEFVENYRASNDGKFPTITNTRQQSGGRHYTVREVLQEMQYNHAKGIVKVTENPMPKDEARALESPGTLEVSEHSMAEDDAEVAQRPLTVEVSEQSLPKDEGKVDQFQGAVEVSEHSLPKGEGKVDQFQGTVEVSEHSLPKGEGKVDQFQGTESESKDVTDKPDSGNQQRQIEANNFGLKNSEKSLDANASNASEESGSDMLNEAKPHPRDDNPKHEESTDTGLLGSLKSFAYGIRNFWRNM